jgi:hypothetical protein
MQAPCQVSEIDEKSDSVATDNWIPSKYRGFGASTADGDRRDPDWIWAERIGFCLKTVSPR